MERGSDTHGPIMDDELRRRTESLERGAPVESRSEEEREEAAPADGEPVADQRLQGGRPAGLDDAEARSELARFVQPSAFPADREALLRSANETGAPEPILRAIRSLPESTVYENVQAVWEHLARPD
jgi:Protein of unknown function (DUF2795)